MLRPTPHSRRIVDRARQMLGTPYLHRGRGRSGIDCLGLFLHAYEYSEADYPEFFEVKEQPAGYYDGKAWSFDKANPLHLEQCRTLVGVLTKHLLPVTIRQAKAGDAFLMSFKIKVEGLGDHVGVYAGSGGLIHADMKAGVVPVQITDSIMRRVVAVYRKPE